MNNASKEETAKKRNENHMTEKTAEHKKSRPENQTKLQSKGKGQNKAEVQGGAEVQNRAKTGNGGKTQHQGNTPSGEKTQHKGNAQSGGKAQHKENTQGGGKAQHKGNAQDGLKEQSKTNFRKSGKAQDETKFRGDAKEQNRAGSHNDSRARSKARPQGRGRSFGRPNEPEEYLVKGVLPIRTKSQKKTEEPSGEKERTASNRQAFSEKRKESKEQSEKQSKEKPKEGPKGISKEQPKEQSKEQPKEQSKEEPKKQLREQPKERQKKQPKERPREQQKKPLQEQPKEQERESAKPKNLSKGKEGTTLASLLQDKKDLVKQLFKSDAYVPMKEKELAVMLQVKKEDRELLRQVLEELLSEGSIQLSSRGRYSEAQEELYTGTFISNQKGFGFIEVEGREEDLFVPENYVHGAFHLDTVQARVLAAKKGRRTEAEVVNVLERNTQRLVGTYEKNKNFGFVVPDNTKVAKDIFIPREQSMGAVDGTKVVVELTGYGNDGKKPEGKVVEVLGNVNDPGVDILSIVKNFELPDTFPEKVLQQAQRAAKPVTQADREERLDLRGLRMVTIDGEDSKDLDDAVSLVRKGRNYQLGVHIADVSNYAQEASSLDREALKRGTSVYLADRVIPMLPHALCNDICSLNEGEDRLALSCLMTVNLAGEVVDYSISESVVCVNRRMTYTAVKGILEGNKALRKEYRPLVHMLERMGKLSAILRANRKNRGSIDFDFPESKLVLDQDGHPLEIKPYDRSVATDLIEDFMLLANETVAKHFSQLEVPFVYRTHEKPDPEKIETLAVFIHNFGYYLKSEKEEVRPKELQKLLAKVAGTPEEAMINRLTLRSMRQAKYTTDCIGHFGLAAPYYCHFTSPIRRYPDLQIHRIIKEQLRGQLGKERIQHYNEILPEVCSQCSKMERRADDAERETEKLKKAEYMESHIGEVCQGVISGITGWGMYVELPNTVEGMVSVAKIPGDYYYYDEAAFEMIGQSTGRKFRLGQQVTIRVEEVNRLNKTIDFSLYEEEE